MTFLSAVLAASTFAQLISRPFAPIPFEHRLDHIIIGSKRSTCLRKRQKSIRSASRVHLVKPARAPFREVLIAADAETMLEAGCRGEWRTGQIELGNAARLTERHVESVGCARRTQN